MVLSSRSIESLFYVADLRVYLVQRVAVELTTCRHTRDWRTATILITFAVDMLRERCAFHPRMETDSGERGTEFINVPVLLRRNNMVTRFGRQGCFWDSAALRMG